MDLNMFHEIRQEIRVLHEWAVYYEHHGRTDIAQENYRKIANLKKLIARMRLISGLRALADFLEEEPDVPVNSSVTISYSVTPADTADGEDSEDAKRAEVDRVAAILDVTPEFWGDGHHYTAVRHFGPVAYRATAITQDHMAHYRAAGTYFGVVTP